MEEMITLTFKDAQGNTQQFEIVDAAAREALESCVTKDANGNVSIEGLLRFLQSSSSYQNCYIRAIDGDANGSVLLIRPGASLILGGGEYATNRWGLGDITLNQESTFIGADGAVYIETAGNTIENRKTWTYNTNGNIVAPAGGTIAESATAPITLSSAGNIGITAASTSAAGSMSATDKTKIDRLTFSAGMSNDGCVTFGDSTNTTAVNVWGNTNNKVGISATNATDNKRYSLLVKPASVTLYNNTDSTEEYRIYPPTNTSGLATNSQNGYMSAEDKSYLSVLYGVGSVVITSENAPPTLPGTWTLIHKKFKRAIVTDAFTPNTTNLSASSNVFLLTGEQINFRIQMTPAVQLGDTTVELGTIDLSRIGITTMYQMQFPYMNDGGNGIAITTLSSAGVLSSVDAINRSGTGTIAAGSNGYLNGTLMFTQSSMIDSFCDEFLWQRTA